MAYARGPVTHRHVAGRRGKGFAAAVITAGARVVLVGKIGVRVGGATHPCPLNFVLGQRFVVFWERRVLRELLQHQRDLLWCCGHSARVTPTLGAGGTVRRSMGTPPRTRAHAAPQVAIH